MLAAILSFGTPPMLFCSFDPPTGDYFSNCLGDSLALSGCLGARQLKILSGQKERDSPYWCPKESSPSQLPQLELDLQELTVLEVRTVFSLRHSH